MRCLVRRRLIVLPAYGVPNSVKIVTGYAWLTTLLICCIVPLDVVSTLRGVNPVAIDDLWDISYWSTQLLTWLLIPIYMGYADAGEFTWKGRMLASVRSNGLFLGLTVRVQAQRRRLRNLAHPGHSSSPLPLVRDDQWDHRPARRRRSGASASRGP